MIFSDLVLSSIREWSPVQSIRLNLEMQLQLPVEKHKMCVSPGFSSALKGVVMTSLSHRVRPALQGSLSYWLLWNSKLARTAAGRLGKRWLQGNREKTRVWLGFLSELFLNPWMSLQVFFIATKHWHSSCRCQVVEADVPSGRLKVTNEMLRSTKIAGSG